MEFKGFILLQKVFKTAYEVSRTFMENVYFEKLHNLKNFAPNKVKVFIFYFYFYSFESMTQKFSIAGSPSYPLPPKWHLLV